MVEPGIQAGKWVTAWAGPEWMGWAGPGRIIQAHAHATKNYRHSIFLKKYYRNIGT